MRATKIRRQPSCDSDVTEPEIEQASFGTAKNAQPTKTEQLDDDSESEDEEELQHRKKPFRLEYRRPPYDPHKPFPFERKIAQWRQEIEMEGRPFCRTDRLVLEALRKGRRQFMAAKVAEDGTGSAVSFLSKARVLLIQKSFGSLIVSCFIEDFACRCLS